MLDTPLRPVSLTLGRPARHGHYTPPSDSTDAGGLPKRYSHVLSAAPSSSSHGCPVDHHHRNTSNTTHTPTTTNLNDPQIKQPQDQKLPAACLADVSGEKNPPYIEIDEESLYTNLRDRVDYLAKFVNFTSNDIEALAELSPILLPLIPQLVDNVYHHLFKFSVTKQAFMPQNDGGEGQMLADLHHLTLDATQIQIRKKTFATYLRKLVTSDYDDFATWQYFDNVGSMHTGLPGLKHRKVMGKSPLRVDLMHLSVLLAWTLDLLTPIILSHESYPMNRRIDIMRALQKVTWIQNDLFTRHYVVRVSEADSLRSIREGATMATTAGSVQGSGSQCPSQHHETGTHGKHELHHQASKDSSHSKPRKSFFSSLGF